MGFSWLWMADGQVVATLICHDVSLVILSGLFASPGGGTDNTIVTSEAFFVDLAGRENEKTTKVPGAGGLKGCWLGKNGVDYP